MELTKEQEDFIIESGTENLIQKRNSRNMCSFCGEKEGVVEYTDDETLQEFRICNTCDWLVCYVEAYGNLDKFEY